MRVSRDSRGGDRLWFDDGEIEAIMEAELRKAHMMPSLDLPVVDLERFIERHLRADLDAYADLPPALLGVTEFFEDRQPRISINRSLTGSALDEDESAPGVLGRYRATLAHEAAHVLLHRSLFDFAARGMNLFEDPPGAPRSSEVHRCQKRDASFGRVTDWREFQANAGMAALLMPKPLFVGLASQEIERLCGNAPMDASRVAPALAARLSVSRQAATIRLATLRIGGPRGPLL